MVNVAPPMTVIVPSTSTRLPLAKRYSVPATWASTVAPLATKSAVVPLVNCALLSRSSRPAPVPPPTVTCPAKVVNPSPATWREPLSPIPTVLENVAASPSTRVPFTATAPVKVASVPPTAGSDRLPSMVVPWPTEKELAPV